MRPETSTWPSPYPLVQPLLTSEVRRLEQAAFALGLSALVLMEHAGRAVAAVAATCGRPEAGPVAVLCGPGSNGGDGYAAARHLALWGYDVRCLHAGLPGPACPDAALEARLAAAGLPLTDLRSDPAALSGLLAPCALLVDALFGVGLARPLGPPWLDVIDALNRAPGLRVSVDVPSGLDADTGAALPRCVRADVTVALVAAKRGYAPGAPGARFAGTVVAADIGLPPQLLLAHLPGHLLTRPPGKERP